VTHCSLRDSDSMCIPGCRSLAGEGCLWFKKAAELGATPPPRYIQNMTPEQINMIEWGIAANTIRQMQAIIEGGCIPGRRSWIDPIRQIAEARSRGEA